MTTRNIILPEIYPKPDEFQFNVRFRVRLYDCDAYGIVHNSNYLRILEDTRVEYFRTLGLTYPKLESVNRILLVADSYMRHLGSVGLDETIISHCRSRDFRNSSVKLEYIVTREKENKLILYGILTLVCVDYETQRPLRLPEKLKEQMIKLDKHGTIENWRF